MYYGTPQHYGQAAAASYPPQIIPNYGVPMQQQQQQQQLYHSAPPYFQQQQQQQPPPFMNPAQPMAANEHPCALFERLLAGLTFNSKPIITELTLLSRDNISWMSEFVAQTLEKHVLTCPPPYRLPALYVIDSICKNVGQPYTTLWSPRIAHIFKETYRMVEQSTKQKMEDLLSTWRTGAIDGTPIFGGAAQWDIEKSIWGMNGPPIAAIPAIRSPMHQSNHGGISPLPQGQDWQRKRRIERMDRLLAIGVHDQHHSPHLYDSDRMEALSKLRALVSAPNVSLSGEQLNQIDSELQSLEAELESKRQTTVPPTTVQQHPATHSPRQGGGPVSLPPALASALANLGKLGVGSTTPPIKHNVLAAQPPQSQPAANLPVPNAQNLIANLLQAVGPALITPLSSPAPSAIQQDFEYSRMIMTLNLRLTTTDMQKELPLGSLEAINFHELPLQCRQCANRYPDGEKGKRSLEQHLDWHFQQNQRSKTSAVRGQSRSWFSKLGEWIRGGHDDDSPSKKSESTASSNVKSATSLTPAQEAELKAATNAFVIAPSDDPGVATKPCPICKELFKSEWSEDEEEWIWKNAVKVNDVYYHGSCHYSAKTLTTTVKQPTGSREGTPLLEEQAVKSTGSRLTQIKEEGGVGATEQQRRAISPVQAGTKRKAEETLVKEEEDEKENTSKIFKSSIEQEDNANT